MCIRDRLTDLTDKFHQPQVAGHAFQGMRVLTHAVPLFLFAGMGHGANAAIGIVQALLDELLLKVITHAQCGQFIQHAEVQDAIGRQHSHLSLIHI